MWGSKIRLGQWTDGYDHNQPTRIVSWEEVYANKKSIRQSEFYASANAGLRPEVMFEVHSHEYKGHDMLEHNGVAYTIIRTYDKGTITELVCQARVGELSG